MDNSGIKELEDKRVLVIGLGKSGIAVLKAMPANIRSVTAVDNNPFIDIDSDLESLDRSIKTKSDILLEKDINERTGLIGSTDIVILSPGVPGDIPLIRSADTMGIPVWSEIEFGWRLLEDEDRYRTVAVTGTNGKTTVVTLIKEIISEAGIHAIACGNIGNPLTGTLGTGRSHKTVRVIEISSFQLERVKKFNPRIGIILNISSDHLDRHSTVSEYAGTKFKLFSNSGKNSWGIFNVDDAYISERLNKRETSLPAGIKIVRYSLNKKRNTEINYFENRIFYSINGKNGEIDISGAKLPGKHNISNMMSAAAAAKILDIDDEAIKKTINGFETLEHRLEFISEISGIRVFNDSKATNPDATIKALESFDEQITLILGGKDKGMDFASMMPCLDRCVSNIILMGETAQALMDTIKSHRTRSRKARFSVFHCGSLKEAVTKGLSITEKGGILLLSPACASFDMFIDYKDRGSQFKKLIMDAKDGRKRLQGI